MSNSKDIQEILGIRDSVVFHKTDGGENILLTCSHLAPIRAGIEKEALNFSITMAHNGKFTAWIHWGDGYIEKCCNRVEGKAMVDIIGGYFNELFFKHQATHSQSKVLVHASCKNLYFKLYLMCDLVHRKLSESIKVIEKEAREFSKGYDVQLDCVTTISRIKQDMDGVFTLITSGRKDIDSILYTSHHSVDIFSDDTLLRIIDEVATECEKNPQHMTWAMTETKMRLRHSLQLIFNDWVCPPWELMHPFVTIRDYLDIDERLIVAEHAHGKWIDLICDITTPQTPDNKSHALMFRISMKSNVTFSFEIHWDDKERELKEHMTETESNEFIKQCYGNYARDTRQIRIENLMEVSLSEPMLVLYLHITCNRIEEETIKIFALGDLHHSTEKQCAIFEQELDKLKLKESSKKNKQMDYDLEELLKMDDAEIDETFIDEEEMRQSTNTARALNLKRRLFSIQHSPYNKSGSSTIRIQDMTAFRSDMHTVIDYITDYDNKKSSELVMLLDMSVTIIQSVAEHLIELASYTDKYNSWIQKESSFLINNTIQLVYRTMNDGVP